MGSFEVHVQGRHPLTYCTNVHPAGSLADFEEVLRVRVAPGLRRTLGAGRLALGAWWPEDVAFALDESETKLRSHGVLLDELELAPVSLNVFPQGRFHGARIKEAVYAPDWRSEARLAYTLAAARAQAKLLEGQGLGQGALSTLPLGFRGHERELRPDREHLRMLFRIASALARLEEDTGVRLVLALEPEPWCLLESVAETVRWHEDELRPFAASQGDEACVRHHVGLCLDLCHAAVLGEDPVAALALCAKANVTIPKVQLSSALDAIGPGGYRRALDYDEPVYLHQLFEQGGEGRFVDLGDPRAQAHSPAEAERWRVHFHVPLHEAGDAELGTTQGELLRFLAAVRAGALEPGTVLEVETYTNPDIEHELAFIVARLSA